MTTIPRGNGEHVLLINDISFVEGEKQLIEQLGYRVTTCTNSENALVLIHDVSRKFDCAIVNLTMPRISGLALANMFLQCRPGIPVLLMGDNACTLSTDSLWPLTITDLILKPFSVQDLAAALHRALKTAKIKTAARRILLVEDDNRSRKMFAKLLEQNGYEVFEAENGRVAMETMLRQPVELVATNMIMPVMDGVETILAIRRHYPNVKIIAISGSGIGSADSCLRISRFLGSHKTLSKPLIPEEFLRAVHDLIG